jgi:hypothetical protein
MASVALLIFVAIFTFGDQLFGWYDDGSRIQIALGLCFALGVLCGYKSRGTS